MLREFRFNKIINWKYVILENATLFDYIGSSDVNFSLLSEDTENKKNISKEIIRERFPYLKRNYRFFDKFFDIQTFDIKERENFLNTILRKVNINNLNKILSISKKTRKKWNIIVNTIKNEDYYIAWFKVDIDKLYNFLQIIEKEHIKGFWVIDLNVYNPYTFFVEAINYFIDIVLQWISVNDERIKNYIKSIWININNLITNMLNDIDFFKEIYKTIQEDVFFKYFKLLVYEKVDTLGRMNIHFYVITKEIKGLHVNYYPVQLESKIIFVKNKNFKALPYVRLNKKMQKLDSISYNFWNIYQNYYNVSDNIDLIYPTLTNLIYKLINKNVK